MADAHNNFAYSLVETAPSPASSGVSLNVTAGQGALFPAVPFNLVIWPAGAQPLSTTAEIVTVTAISGDVLTIVRAQEGTAARTVVIGDQVSAGITKRTLNDVEGNLQPATNMQVQPNFVTVLGGEYVIAVNTRTTIRSGGRLKIL